jgi:ATP-dependent RNA helicase DOB1
LIEEVFRNAVQTLGDDDRELPQVQQMLGLLKRGIGIHHGGLLPILKEVIEILFCEGLIKVLFATETFSMGVNMPAKTVVFTQIRKWDGVDNRVLQSGEYIQMSGRAGRRGKDDRGLCIICLDQKVEADSAKELFMGKSHKIDSTFHLGYNMLLNLMRVEGAHPDYMVQRSLYQFQKDKSVSSLQDEKVVLGAELEGSKTVADPAEHSFDADAAIADYYHVKTEIEAVKEAMRKIIVSPKYGSPFLTTGRLIRVKDGAEEWGWGILTQGTKRKHVDNSDLNEDTEVEWVVDAFLPCAPGSFQAGHPMPGNDEDDAEGHVITLALDKVQEISKIRANLPSGDLRQQASRTSLLQTLRTIQNHPKMVAGIPVLDPVKEMKIDDPKFKDLTGKVSDLEAKLAKNALAGHPALETYEAAFSKRVAKVARLQEVETLIDQANFLVMRDDLRGMKRVLRRLDHIDKQGVVQLKGRMACEISSCDEILLTEIVFQNVFENMQPNHILALCSCLIFDEKSEDPITNEPELLRAFDRCQSIAQTVGEIMHESKLPVDVEEYKNTLKPQLMSVVLSWLEGKKFHEVMAQCDLYEGSVVRAIRRLEELAREIVVAAKTIGNHDLEGKMLEARGKLKRGIIFAASLYL